jgi:hypothetical protein
VPIRLFKPVCFTKISAACLAFGALKTPRAAPFSGVVFMHHKF